MEPCEGLETCEGSAFVAVAVGAVSACEATRAQVQPRPGAVRPALAADRLSADSYLGVVETACDRRALAWADNEPLIGRRVAGLTLTSRRNTYCTSRRARSEAQSQQLSIELSGGELLEMELETLVEPGVETDDGSDDEVIRSDARGDGTLLTVWLVRAGRLTATVRARGVDNAPLELDQLELIARRLARLI